MSGTEERPKRRPGPKPDPARTRHAVTNIRSAPGWKAWLERLAAFDSEARRADANISETVDRALVLYAQSIRFPEAAPKR
ncbi:MAG TPA: hypothetical protein VG406_01810 [Isosphaeraceae bacterium]|nr:hypothetical protein [Isosphaeraceae bacterium]